MNQNKKNINYKNKLSLILFYLFYSICSFGQSELEVCPIINIESTFALESSRELYIDEDVVMRRPSIFRIDSGKANINNGVFIFEYNKFSIAENCSTDENKQRIKDLFFGNSIHQKLWDMETSFIETPEGKYRCYKMNLEVMYLGEKNIPIKEGVKFIEKKIPVYLILDFKKIEAM